MSDTIKIDGDKFVEMQSEIHKEFCPNCEAETPCTHEAELFVCDICGEDFAKYIVSRNCNVSDVSMTRDVSTDVKTPPSIENTNPDYYKQEIARRDEELALTEKKLCNIDRSARAEVARLRSLLTRMSTVGDEIADITVVWNDRGDCFMCLCDAESENKTDFVHAPDCHVTKWQELKKEVNHD